MKAGRWLILAVLGTSLLAAGAVAQDVPLGDLARKNKKDTKSKKVITNEDIPESESAGSTSSSGSGGNATAGNSAPTGDSTAAAGGSAGGEGKAPGSAGQGESAPDEEITEAEAEIANLQKTETNSNKNIEKLEGMMNAEGVSEFRRNMYLDAINRARADIQTLQAQRAEKEKALAEAKEKKKKEAEAAAKAPK